VRSKLFPCQICSPREEQREGGRGLSTSPAWRTPPGVFSLGLVSLPGVVADVFQPTTKADLQDAVDQWCDDNWIGDDISLWDTSLITDMSYQFRSKILLTAT
jgi:hypothetical protein